MKNLKDQVVIVTGAVGNLGSATARALQTSGAKTVLVDRSPDRLREAFPELSGSSGHYLAGGVDLAMPDSLAQLVDETLARFGRVDALVNTVGGYRGGKPVHSADL